MHRILLGNIWKRRISSKLLTSCVGSFCPKKYQLSQKTHEKRKPNSSTGLKKPEVFFNFFTNNLILINLLIWMHLSWQIHDLNCAQATLSTTFKAAKHKISIIQSNHGRLFQAYSNFDLRNQKCFLTKWK